MTKTRRLGAPGALAGLLLLVLGLAVGAPLRAETEPFEADLRNLDGETVKLSALRGRAVLLDLWATWCVPCRQQARTLADLDEVFEEREIAVYALDVGEPLALVKKFVEKEAPHHDILLDPDQVLATELKITELPALILLHPDGTLAAKAVGLQDRDQVLALLDALE